MKITDDFTDVRPAGGVTGTASPTGHPRLVIDVEGRVSIDHGALRFEPLDRDGWGRQAIAYGPYRRAPGLGLAVAMLNGHNTSQVEKIGESLARRFKTWLLAGRTAFVGQRAFRWLAGGHRTRTLREFRRWVLRSQPLHLPPLDENLALGWFTEPGPSHPPSNGESFTMHATGAENGELWVHVGNEWMPALRGVQNVPILYVVLLRERGSAFYAASNVRCDGLGTLPNMRPLALDPFGSDKELYAGIHQAVLGQIGFRVDSRVYGVQVHEVAGAGSWYGLAHFADSLTGSGPLAGSPIEHRAAGGGAELGAIARWSAEKSGFERGDSGACTGEGVVWADTGAPVGLLHCLIETSDGEAHLGLLWRARDRESHFGCRLTTAGCSLGIREAGVWESLRKDERSSLRRDATNSVQVLDDGDGFTVFVNGTRAFGGRVEDRRFSSETGVGFEGAPSPACATVRHLEAHARALPVPAELLLPLPRVERGRALTIDDAFEGRPGDLESHAPPGHERWRRQIGRGRFAIASRGRLVVVASRSAPNPGRTAYTVPWNEPSFAELAIRVTPPGTEHGQGEEGRAGLIFFQDPENYVIVSTWLSDGYDGTSVSSFFQLGGFEELYDAVWSNIGRKIRWGKEYEMRVAFDGLAFSTSINGETVLYRSLTDVSPDVERLAIHRVGLVANWEWGNDTGSVFHRFSAWR